MRSLTEDLGKKPFWGGAILLLAVSGLQATPVCPASGTYAKLESFNAGGGCEIDGVIFSNFTLTDSTSGSNAFAPAGASAVGYNSIPPFPGPHSDIGFNFNSFTLEVLSPGAGKTGTASLHIGYWMESTGPHEDILYSGLISATTTPNSSNTKAGTSSSVTIAETFSPLLASNCLAVTHPTAKTTSSSHTCSFSDPGTSINDYVYFNGTAGIPPTTILKVSKTITATAKGVGIFAQASAFTNIVNVTNPVPEPGFYGLLASGLGGVILFARRRKKIV